MVADQIDPDIRMESLARLSRKFTDMYNCLQVITNNMEYQHVYSFCDIGTVLRIPSSS
jgi:hypothetical protein